MYNPEVIYIEEAIKELEYTKHILAKFPQTKKEFVADINQLIKRQTKKIYDKQNQPLLLAKQRGRFLEKCPGTKEHICCNYYTLNIAVGCPFDCTYCFLQSYTNNPFYTVYVNLDDMLAEIQQKIPIDKAIRIGTGEFTDSLALEEFTNFAKIYIPKILKNNLSVTLELKTKSININWLNNIDFQERLILAWSLNPEIISNHDEKYSAPLKQRIAAAQTIIKLGYKVAFHFDPIIYLKTWEAEYIKVIELLKTEINPAKIAWFSLGLLRFTPSLKPIVEQKFPESRIIYGEFFPGKDGKMRYPKPIRIKVFNRVISLLREWHKGLPIYLCMESPAVWQETLGYPVSTCPNLQQLFHK